MENSHGFGDSRYLAAKLSVAWGLAWFARNHEALAALWKGREGTPRLLRRKNSEPPNPRDNPADASVANQANPQAKTKGKNLLTPVAVRGA